MKNTKKKKNVVVAERRDWNGICPVTRVIPSKKCYTRKEKHKSVLF